MNKTALNLFETCTDENIDFGMIEPEVPSLLAINVPTGLQFGQTTGDITVRGTGHHLVLRDPLSSGIEGVGTSLIGLRVQPQQTASEALDGSATPLQQGVVHPTTDPSSMFSP